MLLISAERNVVKRRQACNLSLKNERGTADAVDGDLVRSSNHRNHGERTARGALEQSAIRSVAYAHRLSP